MDMPDKSVEINVIEVGNDSAVAVFNIALEMSDGSMKSFGNYYMEKADVALLTKQLLNKFGTEQSSEVIDADYTEAMVDSSDKLDNQGQQANNGDGDSELDNQDGAGEQPDVDNAITQDYEQDKLDDAKNDVGATAEETTETKLVSAIFDPIDTTVNTDDFLAHIPEVENPKLSRTAELRSKRALLDSKSSEDYQLQLMRELESDSRQHKRTEFDPNEGKI